jgi:hypothetical protein
MHFRECMKRIAIALSLLLICAACNQGPQSQVTSVPGKGAISVTVQPNPIVATRVSGDTYDLPFDVIVRETGGRPVTVTGVTATVFGPGNITVGRESWDADRIRSMGYNLSLNPHGELRYRFTPRREVTDDRIFGALKAELRVEAVDDTGTATSASTEVTVRR